jgi:hypothetical protein
LPERREELGIDVDSFRGVAGPDGRLSSDLELVVADVFADLIARAAVSRVFSRVRAARCRPIR